jgi:hypothetical protein
MAVRSAMPWPLRWALAAIVFGFCAAISLWAFEFGKNIAGLDQGAQQALLRLREQVSSLQTELAKAREERDKAQSIANTAGTLLTTEKSAQDKLLLEVKQLEADNRALRDDLGFFETLIPSSGVEGLAIRGLQAELQGTGALKWQALVMQSNKGAAEFNGRLELTFTGLLNGKPWTASLPEGPQSFKIRQYGRLGGVYEVPAQVVVKGISARVLDGSTVRASRAIKF